MDIRSYEILFTIPNYTCERVSMKIDNAVNVMLSQKYAT